MIMFWGSEGPENFDDDLESGRTISSLDFEEQDCEEKGNHRARLVLAHIGS